MIKRPKLKLSRRRNPEKAYYFTVDDYYRKPLIAEGSEEKLEKIQREYDHYSNLIIKERDLDSLLAFLVSQYIQGIGISDFVKQVISEQKLEKLRKYHDAYVKNKDLEDHGYWGEFIEQHIPINADKLNKYLYER